jgi:phosphate transport system substrate-binding protein
VITRKIVAITVAIVIMVATLGAILILNKSNPTNDAKTFIDQAGSETMYELCLKWASDYGERNDRVQVNVTRGGSGPGIAALLDHKVDIAQASRKMNSAELANATAQNIHIIELKVALDGIAMIVNPALYNSNITELSLGQLKGIYNGSISNWKDLGGPDVPVIVFGRNDTSGTYVFFQQNVLNNENYTSNMREYPNYDLMIADILSTKGAIGYVGVGFVNNYPDVKILSLRASDAFPAYKPTQVNVESFDYPLARYLYLYLREIPSGNTLDYIKWIIDQQFGQAVVIQQGFYPIPQSVTSSDMALLTEDNN